MANTNKDRKKRASSINKSNKKNISKFNKKSVDIFAMTISLLIFIFLLSEQTGSLGIVLTDFFINLFGLLAYIIPIIIFVSFFFSLIDKYLINIKLFISFYLLVLFSMILLSNNFILNDLDSSLIFLKGNIADSGGIIGLVLAYYVINLIGIVGAWIIFISLLLIFLIGLSPLTYREFFVLCKNKIFTFLHFTFRKIKLAKEKKKESNKEDILIENASNAIENIKENDLEKENLTKAEELFKDDFTETQINEYKSKQVDLSEFDETFKKEYKNYNYPSIDLLKDNKKKHKLDTSYIKQKAKKIEETLDSFGINSRVVQINVGPTVTCFELQPARGIKVSRILSLSDDLSLALATSDIRIEAPIPGTSHVGIEVSNDKKEVVSFKEMITSDEYINSNNEIPFAIGKSISGKVEVSGIEKMPHLLVSGATGSGKSVCINTIIMSILYKHAPDEVKLLMIDPKVVELSIYNGIPHLIMPVITDPKKASSSLFWAISEMERRYKLFEENHVRDISSYRQLSEMDDNIEKLPYIVIIIDELSDLMMTSASEVEDYITRLAQKSRACGIHLIIATQRPTVDVITGTIKANIPSRIAFAVSSQIDSRTILDMSGAEKLLGKGDMLFAPSDSMKPKRIQGAFVSDEEVLAVVNSIKKTNQSEYNEKAIEKVEEKTQLNVNDQEDDLIDEAINIIVNEQTASVSLLQRKLKIGYARAGRIIDQLENRGIVGGYEGSKPRKVLVDRTFLEGE